MGLRGPKPKPADLARADGTYRADRHGETVVLGERITPGELPAAPAHFDEARADVWAELLEAAAEYDLLREVDLAACEMMTVALVTFRQADELVARDGVITEIAFGVDKSSGVAITRDGPNPALAIRDKAAAEFRAWAARFGFTPSDRVGLGLGALKARSAKADLEKKIGPSPRGRATT